MKTKAVMIALLFLTGILTVALAESTVSLKSGEVLKGDILSETNGVFQIRVYSANRTISSRRSVSRSDIQEIQTETPAQAAERVDYFALSKLQLDPDQEQSTGFYTHWIPGFEKFFRDYPKSDKTTTVQQWLETCQTELKHVAAGEVKFANQWMTPAEKKPQVLMKQLAGLESQRDSLAQTVAAAQGSLSGLQATLPSFFDSFGNPIGDSREPIYATRDDGSANHYTVRYATGEYRTIPNPERVRVQADIVSYQRQVASGRQALANLDAKIQSVKFQISQVQHTPLPPPSPSPEVDSTVAPPAKPRGTIYYEERNRGARRGITQER